MKGENNMKIVIGTDHAGFKEKEKLKVLLKKEKLNIIDIGSFDEKAVDYPTIAFNAVTEYHQIRDILFGVLLCGTGIGMSIAANRYGVRAARCCCMQDVEMAREHNNAEFICLGVRQELKVEDLKEMILKFINHEFSGDERHIRRVKLVNYHYPKGIVAS